MSVLGGYSPNYDQPETDSDYEMNPAMLESILHNFAYNVQGKTMSPRQALYLIDKVVQIVNQNVPPRRRSNAIEGQQPNKLIEGK